MKRVAGAGLLVMALCGCGKAPEFPAVPPRPEGALPATSSASAGDTSVRDAATAFAPASAASTGAADGRSNKAMSQAQESTAMPMPGQNNDHSAPLGPAKPASASQPMQMKAPTP